MAKKKQSYIQRKQKETTNTKALIWIGSALGVIVIILAILVILDT